MANIVGRYFSFEGRLARLPFFGRGFYLGVIAVALAMVSIPFFSREGLWWWFSIPIVIASLVLLAVGSFSLTIRRLHDLGLSGYHAIWVGAAQAVWAPLSYGPPEVEIFPIVTMPASAETETPIFRRCCRPLSRPTTICFVHS
jgi:uncharacterized membrane protein YhaH (DUF805 family)